MACHCALCNKLLILKNSVFNNLKCIIILSTIEKYLKSIQNVDSDLIESPCLPKSKSYMKIIELPYKIKQVIITPDCIEGVLKETHLFKDVVLASKPHVIKAFPKSNMIVV